MNGEKLSFKIFIKLPVIIFHSFPQKCTKNNEKCIYSNLLISKWPAFLLKIMIHLKYIQNI